MSLHEVIITVPYKVDMSNDGDIMPFYMYTTVFPRATAEQLEATKDTK